MSDYFVFVGAGVFIIPLIALGFWAHRAEEREYKRRVESGRI